MRRAVRGLLLLTLASCASAGSAEEFKWTVDCPKSVDKGAEFTFTVRAVRPGGPEVPGVSYLYQISWTGGSGSPLRHRGTSGAASKMHARMTPGPAIMVVTCPNREGLDVKVAEATFEVK
jgi:hypothetical protein